MIRYRMDILAALKEQGVEVRGTDEVREIVACEPARDEDWDTEYLALIVSVKLVDDVDERLGVRRARAQ